VTDPLKSLSDPQHERFDLRQVVGLDLLLDSGLPSVVFVIVYTTTGQRLTQAIWAAIGAGVILAVLRLVRRQPLQNVVAGFFGLLIAAYVVSRTGRPQDIALPTLLINAAYLIGYVVSILVRWPLLGVLVGAISGNLTEWRKDPRLLRAYTAASWLWVGMFALRLAVLVPLYLQGSEQLGWLVTMRLVMGWPLFGLTVWLSWLIIRRATTTRKGPGTDVPSPSERGTSSP
jgi:Protein of unknown function (DUF3159)